MEVFLQKLFWKIAVKKCDQLYFNELSFYFVSIIWINIFPHYTILLVKTNQFFLIIYFSLTDVVFEIKLFVYIPEVHFFQKSNALSKFYDWIIKVVLHQNVSLSGFAAWLHAKKKMLHAT